MIQTLVSDSLRGRVMSIHSFSFFGLMPLGSLWVGLIAEHLSEPAAIIINAVILLGVFSAIRIFVPKLYNLA
jgi:hydrogenase/urease accessory protein HupE